MFNKVLFVISLAVVSVHVTAATFSQASIHFGGLLPTETVGGTGEVLAEISNAGFDDVLNATRNYSASSYASTLNRRVAFELSSSILVPASAPSAVLSAPVEASNRAIDTINIGAGGRFNIGDPVQILLQVRFDASVHIEGRPSGGTQGDFELRANAGAAASQLLIDYSTGGLNPPQDFEVHEFWTFLIDATVGGVVTYDSYMRGTINGTAFDPGISGTNAMIFDPIIAFSHAPGFKGLVLTADSGAPISPISLSSEPFPWEIFMPAILRGAR